MEISFLEAAEHVSFRDSELEEAYLKGVREQWRMIVEDDVSLGRLHPGETAKFFEQGVSLRLPDRSHLERARFVGSHLGSLASYMHRLIDSDSSAEHEEDVALIRGALPADRMQVWSTLEALEETSVLHDSISVDVNAWQIAFVGAAQRSENRLSDETKQYVQALLDPVR